MGVGDSYGLFACMVTSRSWEAVTGGISKSSVDEEEVWLLLLYTWSNQTLCLISFIRIYDLVSFFSFRKHISLLFQRNEIKAYAASLIPQISLVLHKMPRPMLLILKTNDLLRSIEYRLGTQNRIDAFIQVCLKDMWKNYIIII